MVRYARQERNLNPFVLSLSKDSGRGFQSLQRDLHSHGIKIYSTSTTISTSTGAPPGRLTTPTAERA